MLLVVRPGTTTASVYHHGGEFHRLGAVSSGNTHARSNARVVSAWAHMTETPCQSG